MYHALSFLTGVVIAVMVFINGGLSEYYGIFVAAVIIHIVGVVFAFVLCAAQGKRIPPRQHQPLWIYLGGAIGVLTTVFNNFAFGKISMTSIVALGLLGQTAASLATDCLGLFGMEQHPFKRESFIGLGFSLFGIFIMMDRTVGSAACAALFSLAAGVSVVLSRTVNACLARYTGDFQGSLVNHLVGLPITIVVAALVIMRDPAAFADLSCPSVFSTQAWIYCGGILGVSTVLLCNITVPRVSAFRLTLLTFVGQLFTGILLDLCSKNTYPGTSFVGGIVVAVGMVFNLVYEHVSAVRKPNGKSY